MADILKTVNLDIAKSALKRPSFASLAREIEILKTVFNRNQRIDKNAVETTQDVIESPADVALEFYVSRVHRDSWGREVQLDLKSTADNKTGTVKVRYYGDDDLDGRARHITIQIEQRPRVRVTPIWTDTAPDYELDFWRIEVGRE